MIMFAGLDVGGKRTEVCAIDAAGKIVWRRMVHTHRRRSGGSALEGFGMTGAFRGQYTLEFKQEAVRLVRGGVSKSSVAKTLGISGQTLHNWVKSEAAGRLREVSGKSVGADQLEIARLKAEPAKTRVERDILKKRRRILRVSRCEIRLCRATSKSLADNDAMPGAEHQRQRLSPISSAPDGGHPFLWAWLPDWRCALAGSREGDFQ
jgi:transposase